MEVSLIPGPLTEVGMMSLESFFRANLQYMKNLDESAENFIEFYSRQTNLVFL